MLFTLAELEQKQEEYMERGKPEVKDQTLGEQYKDLIEALQKYCADSWSMEWKNGYLYGYRDCLKELKHLESACAELAENGKGANVGLLNGGKVIMAAMELFGYEINTESAKYERR